MPFPAKHVSLLDIRMHDGSRHFASLPQHQGWPVLRDRLEALEGAVVTSFVTDGITEAWLDFTFREHSFAVNDQLGEYWFFVDDPQCPDAVLSHIVSWCSVE